MIIGNNDQETSVNNEELEGNKAKSKPLLELTNKQRASLKSKLDSKVIQDTFILLMDKSCFDKSTHHYDSIVNALRVLGVTIEGHEPISDEVVISETE